MTSIRIYDNYYKYNDIDHLWKKKVDNLKLSYFNTINITDKIIKNNYHAITFNDNNLIFEKKQLREIIPQDYIINKNFITLNIHNTHMLYNYKLKKKIKSFVTEKSINIFYNLTKGLILNVIKPSTIVIFDKGDYPFKIFAENIFHGMYDMYTNDDSIKIPYNRGLFKILSVTDVNIKNLKNIQKMFLCNDKLLIIKNDIYDYTKKSIITYNLFKDIFKKKKCNIINAKKNIPKILNLDINKFKTIFYKKTILEVSNHFSC